MQSFGPETARGCGMGVRTETEPDTEGERAMAITTMLFFGGLAGIAAAGVVLWRVHKSASQAGEEMVYRRCAHCGQKLRFPAAKAGRQGRCPRCGRENLLIAGVVTEAPSAVRVGRVRRPSRQQETSVSRS